MAQGPGIEKLSRQGVLRRLMPSMYHRRLSLLAAVVLVAMALLFAQMSRLTVAQHETLRVEAESVLTIQRLIPTARGRILDRHQRVLARDRPSHDVAVEYRVITGAWALKRGRQAAYKANAQRWRELTADAQARLAAEHGHLYDQQTDRMWDALAALGGVRRTDLEERKSAILQRVQQMAGHVWLHRYEEQADAGEAPVKLSAVAQPIREQTIGHSVLTNVDHLVIAEVNRLVDRGAVDPEYAVWQQISVVPSKHREHLRQTHEIVLDRTHFPRPLRSDQPLSIAVHGVAMHIVGTMRDAWKRDFEGLEDRHGNVIQPGRPFHMDDLGGYLAGDRAGSTGIEQSQERRLRGTRGLVVEDRVTLEQQRREPVAGQDVVLTIDVQLQARIQALMSQGDEADPMQPGPGLMRRQPWHKNDTHSVETGQPLNGAAVVLEVSSSQVLAAVGIPTIGLEQIRADPEAYATDFVNQPYLNRPVAISYPPGSTVKPLVLAAAITEGELDVNGSIECTGVLNPGDPDHYRCWIYKHYEGQTHGLLSPPAAIANSCNVFFYTLGQRLGARRLVGWFDRFGVGRITGCGLDEQVPGHLPDLAEAGYPNAPGFSDGDARFLAIGQGPIGWTVLHAASCYAALARGGYMISPTFLLTDEQETFDLHLHPRGVDQALQGLADAVSDHSATANHMVIVDADGHVQRPLLFDLEGVQVSAKTGTADTGRTWLDENGDGQRQAEEVKKRGDHAWTIALVKRQGAARPDFVIAVVVEHAGSGGQVAGPIVNQISHALRAEGYL